MVNDDTFKVCPNKLKLVFNGGTTISKIAISKIPSHQFKFKSIEYFLSGNFINDLLYSEFLVCRQIMSLSLFGFVTALKQYEDIVTFFLVLKCFRRYLSSARCCQNTNGRWL